MGYVPAMQEFAGKTAVITGAASGMGLAFAERFARAGMNIVLTDIEEPTLAEAETAVRAEATAAGHDIETMTKVVDVADAAAVQALADESIERFGQINLLFNNAGVGGSSLSATPGHIDLNDWKWVIDVNLWGVINGHAAFLPHMLEHGDGHIVNTASMAGHFPGHSAYAASKWAVVGITEGLFGQLDALDSTLGVSCLCPGWVDTKIAESARNRPEWAAPSALTEPTADQEARNDFIKEALASGMAPDQVAQLVYDAIVAGQFWIFTDMNMVQALDARYDAVRNVTNPALDLGSALSSTN